jgi:predicted GNAT family acetyltransferase
MIGPRAQVLEARGALGLDGAKAVLDQNEGLYALPLDELIVPAALTEGHVSCRSSREHELELLTDWRVAYTIEALGGGSEKDNAAKSVRDQHERGVAFVLERNHRQVAFSAFNASLPDMVQIGGVWTPPVLRGRGFARCVVAGSLLHARENGVRRAILFTGDENVGAVKAYKALGFRHVGEFGLVLLS